MASLNYDRSLIVLATVITIVNYDHKTFIVQGTDLKSHLIMDAQISQIVVDSRLSKQRNRNNRL